MSRVAASPKHKSVLNVVSMETRYANPTGAPLSQANGKADAEITFDVGTKPLLDIRVIEGTRT